MSRPDDLEPAAFPAAGDVLGGATARPWSAGPPAERRSSEPVPTLPETAQRDPGPWGRRGAVVAPAWSRPADPRIRRTLLGLQAEGERVDPGIRFHAEHARSRHEAGIA